MKKILKIIIEKSNEIKKRIEVKGKHYYNSEDSLAKAIRKRLKAAKGIKAGKLHHDEEDELDDHNDSSNWSYA